MSRIVNPTDLEQIKNTLADLRILSADENEVLDKLIETLKWLQMNNVESITFQHHKDVLKELISEKCGNDTLMVHDISSHTSFNYPIIKETYNGFKQKEIVLDISIVPNEVAIILDIFNEDELRICSNGCVTFDDITKINIDKFVEHLKFERQSDIKILKDLLK